MNRFILALLLCCGSLQAADVNLFILGGKYHLVAADGSSKPVTVKILNFDGSDPTPQPGPTPDPNLTVRAKAIRDAALTATGDPDRANTAQDLAILYSEVAKKVTAGEIKTQANISAVIKAGADMLLSAKGQVVVDAWKPTRNVLSDQWVALAQEGGNDPAFAKLLNEASSGLRASVPVSSLKAVQSNAISVEMILKIIQMVMELLKLIPASQGGGL